MIAKLLFIKEEKRQEKEAVLKRQKDFIVARQNRDVKKMVSRQVPVVHQT